MSTKLNEKGECRWCGKWDSLTDVNDEGEVLCRDCTAEYFGLDEGDLEDFEEVEDADE